jgi:hypothetical protein
LYFSSMSVATSKTFFPAFLKTLGLLWGFIFYKNSLYKASQTFIRENFHNYCACLCFNRKI